jgi:hypothetical protein
MFEQHLIKSGNSFFFPVEFSDKSDKIQFMMKSGQSIKKQRQTFKNAIWYADDTHLFFNNEVNKENF